MSSATPAGIHGPSLVIGGCGFLGFHIVAALLKEPAWGPVLVIGRNPDHNRCEGASYHKGDVCNSDEIRRLLADLKPRIIFHTAAPRSADPAIAPGNHLRTSVDGTKTVLSAAKDLLRWYFRKGYQ
jgi:sterol-4alpha-carboxylate 3-dehydrogenase (decarboxylating)